jgi:hypothetical protein
LESIAEVGPPVQYCACEHLGANTESTRNRSRAFFNMVLVGSAGKQW